MMKLFPIKEILLQWSAGLYLGTGAALKSPYLATVEVPRCRIFIATFVCEDGNFVVQL